MKSLFLNDRLIFCLIVLNTLCIFTDGVGNTDEYLKDADTFFTLFFLLETVVKIHASGWKSYWQDGWNRFDFVIIMLALPSLGSLFVEDRLAEMNVILAFRVLRAFKSFLLFRHVPNISRILSGLRLAVKASVLVCVAYLVFLIVFSMLTFSLFSDDAPQFFGTPLLSMYSTFRLFTVEGWYEMPEAVVQGGSVTWGIFVRLYFAVLLFVGGIMGLSLVNSIFVDAMVSDNNDELLEKLDRIEKELQQLSDRQQK